MKQDNIQVYVGATLSNRGARLQNEETKKTLEQAGLQAYLPQDDKSINDKANADPKGLAERIVEKDLRAMNESDMYLFDITETTGTTAEVGYIKGRQDMARDILKVLQEQPHSTLPLIYLARTELEKPFIATCSDFRRENHSPQAGDRREWSINQMLYGLVLDLTKGKGFTEFEDLENGSLGSTPTSHIFCWPQSGRLSAQMVTTSPLSLPTQLAEKCPAPQGKLPLTTSLPNVRRRAR